MVNIFNFNRIEFLPEKFKHLIHLVQLNSRLAIFQFTDKAYSNPGPFRKFDLGKSILLPFTPDIISKFHYNI